MSDDHVPDSADRPADVPAQSVAPASVPVRPPTLEDRIRVLADEAAVDSGLFIIGVSVKGHPGSRLVEVFADGEEGGIDDLAGLTRRINMILDVEDPIAGRYRLDVSTPGADQPLVDIRQYPKHVGRTLRVRIAPVLPVDMAPGDTGAPEAEIVGTLTAATADSITIQPDAGDAVEIPVARIHEARVVLPW